MDAKMSIDMISFEKVSRQHLGTIFQWLAAAHMIEFWDNSQEHKDDIANFVNGRVEPSSYFDGIFTYWIGKMEEEPFCLIMTAEVKADDDCPPIWIENRSKTGKTYSLDFGIGNVSFLGKGLASITLEKFTQFFHAHVDPATDTFFIDPDDNNPRARHVYAKAGFELVGEFNSEKKYWDFSGHKTYLMVKHI